MIDVSDGLLKDLERMCLSSQLNAAILEEKIPRAAMDGAPVPLSRALLDGEDYELLFAVSQAKHDQLLEEWPFSVGLTEIGKFSKSQGNSRIFNESGDDMVSRYGTGFNHFS
jgi:thiamine-monophosphate kinase